jgi:hypothetical protein
MLCQPRHEPREAAGQVPEAAGQAIDLCGQVNALYRLDAG